MTEITVSRSNNVVTVALNRPKQHNAMTPTLIRDLTSTFHELGQDESVRVIILTGNGRSFCAGADLNYMRSAADFSFEDNLADGKAIFDLMAVVNDCPKPVVGRINGAAIGGGAGLTSCCDITVAVARAKFAFSEARLGIVPATISPFVLTKIGVGNGRELFLTGEVFSAEKAQQIGLIQHVAAEEMELDAMVTDRVTQLLQAAPGAQTVVKELIASVSGQPIAETRDYTADAIAQRRASAEGKEGMSSFLEKRKPGWQTNYQPNKPSN
jgi:methylglutaconyl-CoA hydratase